MTTLRRSHAVWVLRRAVALEEAAQNAPGVATDRARAAMLREITDKLTTALDTSEPLRLTIDERNALLAEARSLAEQTARELRRNDVRDLAVAEGWMLSVRALLEVAGAGG